MNPLPTETNSEPTIHQLFDLNGKVALITGGTGHLGSAMSRALAEAVRLPDDAISVKPKTNEGMGFIGRGEGLAVLAVATLEGP